MDNATLVIALIFVGLSIVPFVFVVRARKKRTNELLNKLKTAAETTDSQLTHFEIEGNMIVALDQKKGFFYFLNLKEEGSKVNVTDLLEFKGCICHKEYHLNKEQTLKRITLEFHPQGTSKAIKKLIIYDSSVNFQASGELPFAEKWAGILNGLIEGSEPIEKKLDHKVVELID